MADLESTLDQMLAGKYDLAVAKKRNRAQELYEQYFELAAKGGDQEKLEELGKELSKLDAEIGGITPGKKFDPEQVRQQARFQNALREYQMAMAQGKSEEEIADLEKQVKQHAPTGFDFDDFKHNFTLQRAFMNYYRAATAEGDADQLEKLGRQLEAEHSKNAMMLNDIAWNLLTDEKIKHRDLKLAMHFAKAAYDASEGKDANIVDTYARALFDTGKVKEAIRYQKEAVKLCENEDQVANLKKTLQQYQEKAD